MTTMFLFKKMILKKKGDKSVIVRSFLSFYERCVFLGCKRKVIFVYIRYIFHNFPYCTRTIDKKGGLI